MSYDDLVINAVYDEIIKKISGGTVYGIPVVLDNMKLLVIAAYHLGRTEEMRDDIKSLEGK